jgi:carbonic anhydrase
MCRICDLKVANQESRRNFLKATTVGLGATLLAASSLPIWAAGGTPPKPENVMSPEEALQRLIEGNGRYIANTPLPSTYEATRAALVKGQNPYACILGCSDSRVNPDLCFDAGRGDLFVARVAGNFVTPEILASLEYGTAVLQSPLIMVLGHTSCGAIQASIKAVKNDEDFPGHIQLLASSLTPAIDAALKKDPSNVEASAIRENVRINVEALKNSTPILRRLVQSKKLMVVGGIYDLNTGRVEIV